MNEPTLEKLVLGTVQLGLPYGVNNTTGKPNEAIAIELLKNAYYSGIRLLDTAEAYGDAHSVIGAYHRTFPDRSFGVITKLAAGNVKSGTSLDDLVRSDLAQLHVPRLYAYMFHNYRDFCHFYRDIPLLVELRSEGFIEKLGVSVYTNEEAMEAIDSRAIHLIQLPFNMLDNINQRGAIFRSAKDADIEIHVRSVFLQGLFFRPLDSLPSRLLPLKKYLTRLHHLSVRLNRPMEELALQYVYMQPAIDKLLIGVDKSEQLATNIKALSAGYSEELAFAVNEIVVEEVDLLQPYNWEK